ncbi:hypothetical protein PSTT_12017 [Puccinia striiformis]|uniref:Uncharacterized protein n=1 Tax=Puccinia striiformis TaxID=27350 RepID=A0A2S4UY91_9BASI|nr:hypothetical protein PSTT_12017 [Puccinia striiformis]
MWILINPCFEINQLDLRGVWVMDDLERTSNPLVALILEALNCLVQVYATMRGETDKEKKEVTQDESDEKNRLLDKLQSSLLLSIKSQLGILVTSLDLFSRPTTNSKKHPVPDWGLTLENLAKLD